MATSDDAMPTVDLSTIQRTPRSRLAESDVANDATVSGEKIDFFSFLFSHFFLIFLLKKKGHCKIGCQRLVDGVRTSRQRPRWQSDCETASDSSFQIGTLNIVGGFSISRTDLAPVSRARADALGRLLGRL